MTDAVPHAGRATSGGAVRREDPSSRPEDRPVVEKPALVAALVAIAIGGLVLIGWASGLQPLRSFVPVGPPMKANAALMVVLLGAALAMRAARYRPRLADGFAIIVVGVASATAVEYATGLDLGIDRLLAPDVVLPNAPYAGRMAMSTAVALLAASLAVVSLGGRQWGRHARTAVIVVVGLAGAAGVLGTMYGVRQLTNFGSATQIALPTALAFVVLFGGLIAADPQHGLMPLLRDPGLAGKLTRRLTLTTVLVLPLAGWLKLLLVEAGILDDRLGTAVIVAVEILILGAVGTWTAGGVLRLERSRAAAQRERDEVAATLAARADELRLTNGRLHDALAEARRFGEALDHVSAFIYMKNTSHQYVYANRPTLELFGCSAEDLVGSDDARFFPPEAVAHLRAVEDRVLLEGEDSAEEIESTDRAGVRRVYWEVKTRLDENADGGEPWGLIGISTDITERKRSEDAVRRLNEELEQQAMRDPLTGLANRRLLDELLAASMGRVARSGQAVQVAYLDLDGFKAINDRHGHAAGDAVLRETAERLKRAVRAGDIVARVGGDEFVIVLQPALTAPEQFRARIEHTLGEPIDVGGGLTVRCHASVGLAESTGTTSPAQLLDAADAAMYGRKAGEPRPRADGQVPRPANVAPISPIPEPSSLSVADPLG